LYLAIHGGDPAPKEGTVVAHDQQQGAALGAIAALSEVLDEKARDAVHHALAPIQKQFPEIWRRRYTWLGPPRARLPWIESP